VALFAFASTSAPAVAADERSSSSTHFVITYSGSVSDPSAPDLADADEDGVPDSVARALAMLEEVRQFQIDQLGFRPPPGDERYPIYVAPGGFTRPLPGSDRSRASYIVMSPGLFRSETTDAELAAFVAHEFAHAIQYGYDYLEDDWFKEASASWMEDAFDDDSDRNHLKLRDFIPYPRLGLTSPVEGHEYGAFLFIEFLEERFGQADQIPVIRQLWELASADPDVFVSVERNSTEAIEVFLEERGSSWPSAWAEFLRWTWQLSRFEEGTAYKEVVSDQWPRVLRASAVSSESCRLTTDRGLEGLPPLSGDFVRLDLARLKRQKEGTLAIVGPPGATGFALLVGPVSRVTHDLVFDASGVARLDATLGPSAVRRVLLGLGNGATGGPEVTISYSLAFDGASKVVASSPSSPSVTTFGTAVPMSGTVTCGGVPAAEASVELSEVSGDGSPAPVRLKTDEHGRWSYTASPAANARYSVEVVDALISSAVSEPIDIAVRTGIEIAVDSSNIELGHLSIVDGGVFPSHPGAVMVIEFRRPQGEWREGAVVVVDGGSRYDAALQLPARGVWELRARVSDTGDDDHEPGSSVTETVFVRDPVSSSSGV
jgi:hypothetical protein